jgi:hypothetical protein
MNSDVPNDIFVYLGVAVVMGILVVYFFNPWGDDDQGWTTTCRRSHRRGDSTRVWSSPFAAPASGLR